MGGGSKPLIVYADADVDECEEDDDQSPCGDDEMCQNTVGSFVCRPRIDCGPGYRLNVSTSSCDGR